MWGRTSGLPGRREPRTRARVRGVLATLRTDPEHTRSRPRRCRLELNGGFRRAVSRARFEAGGEGKGDGPPPPGRPGAPVPTKQSLMAGGGRGPRGKRRTGDKGSRRSRRGGEGRARPPRWRGGGRGGGGGGGGLAGPGAGGRRGAEREGKRGRGREERARRDGDSRLRGRPEDGLGRHAGHARAHARRETAADRPLQRDGSAHIARWALDRVRLRRVWPRGDLCASVPRSRAQSAIGRRQRESPRGGGSGVARGPMCGAPPGGTRRRTGGSGDRGTGRGEERGGKPRFQHRYGSSALGP